MITASGPRAMGEGVDQHCAHDSKTDDEQQGQQDGLPSGAAGIGGGVLARPTHLLNPEGVDFEILEPPEDADPRPEEHEEDRPTSSDYTDHLPRFGQPSLRRCLIGGRSNVPHQ